MRSKYLFRSGKIWLIAASTSQCHFVNSGDAAPGGCIRDQILERSSSSIPIALFFSTIMERSLGRTCGLCNSFTALTGYDQRRLAGVFDTTEQVERARLNRNTPDRKAKPTRKNALPRTRTLWQRSRPKSSASHVRPFNAGTTWAATPASTWKGTTISPPRARGRLPTGVKVKARLPTA